MPSYTRPFVSGLISHKGGGGRSTAAFTMAESLMLQGRNVLLVDMDVEAPGLPLFSRMTAPGGGMRIALCPIIPECLRKVADGNFLSENIKETENYGNTSLRREYVLFPGFLDWLARTLEDLGLWAGESSFTDRIRGEVATFLQGYRNADNLMAVEQALREGVHNFIYELWPGKGMMPAYGFVMPVGGHFHRSPEKGRDGEAGEGRRWQYAANNRPLPGNDRGSPFAIPLVAREFLLAGLNLNAILVAGVTDFLRKRGIRLDFVIIDYRPGDTFLTETASLAADGATYVSVASSGAMASFYDNLREHKNLFKSAGEKKIPAIVGNLYCKLASDKDSQWKYAPLEEKVFKGDGFARFALKDDYLDAALQVSCHHLFGAVGLLPIFPWNREKASKSQKIMEAVENAWRYTGHGTPDSEVKRQLLPLPLDGKYMPVEEQGFRSLTISADAASGWRLGSEEGSVIYDGAKILALLAMRWRDYVSRSGNDYRVGNVEKVYFPGETGDDAWKLTLWLARRMVEGRDAAASDDDSSVDTLPAFSEDGDILTNYLRILVDFVRLMEEGIEGFHYENVGKAKEKKHKRKKLARKYLEEMEENIERIIRDEAISSGREAQDINGLKRSFSYILGNVKFGLFYTSKDEDYLIEAVKIFSELEREVKEILKESDKGGFLTGVPESSRIQLQRILIFSQYENILYHIKEIIDGSSRNTINSEKIVQLLREWFEEFDATIREMGRYDQVVEWLGKFSLTRVAARFPDQEVQKILAELLVESANVRWVHMDVPTRAQMIAAYVHACWLVPNGMAKEKNEARDRLVERLDSVHRTLMASTGTTIDAESRLWLALGYLEMAHRAMEAGSLDAAIDFSLRAAGHLHHMALEDGVADAWFLLALARTVTRYVLSAQQNRKQGADTGRLEKKIATVRRDAFYAYEQWHALVSAIDGIKDYNIGNVSDYISNEESKFDEEVKNKIEEEKGGAGFLEALLCQKGYIERYYNGDEAATLDRELDKALDLAMHHDRNFPGKYSGTQYSPYHMRENMRKILQTARNLGRKPATDGAQAA